MSDIDNKELNALQNAGAPVEIKPLEEMTVKELQVHLTNLGFVGAESLTTKSQLIGVINYANAKSLVDKVDSKPVKPKEVNEVKSYESKKQRMKDYLWKQPVVPFYIPLDQGEKKGVFFPWQCNGYRLNILKGTTVRIPKPVADNLEWIFDMTAKAGEEFLMDRDEKVVKALTNGGDPETVGQGSGVTEA